MIVERIGAKNAGILLMAVSGGLLLAAGLISWFASQRWLGIANLHDYQISAIEHDTDNAMAAAKQAASYQPDLPATALAAVELTNPSDRQRLERLQRSALPGAQRAMVEAVLAFHDVVNGKAVADLPGGDGVLIKRIAALARDGAPADLAWPKDDPPHASLVAYYLQRLVQLGWQTGNRDLLRRAVGPLALLIPFHAEVGRLLMLAAVLDKDFPADRLRGLLDRCGKSDERTPFVRQLAQLVPERADQILAMVPPAERNEDENQRLNLNSNENIEAAVNRLLGSGQINERNVLTLSRRCYDAGRFDLAKRLAERAPANLQSDLLMIVAVQEGDLARIGKLAPGHNELLPRVSTPLGRPGLVSFHLATPGGLVPRGPGLEVRLNGKPASPERITRFGSLIAVATAETGSVQLEVKLGETLLYAGQIKL